MDYDDDEFEGQNRQLAGEGCSKVSSVLHPYALPKFDFDDTLHEHLSFNSLVENEVFLGIDFNSSGVESRRNNVWSEATSSESVEMLLKSVGQEEKVVGKPVIGELDDPSARDETVSLTQAMDPNLNQESHICGGELDSVHINEKHELSVLEEKLDNKFDDAVAKDSHNKDNPGISENVGVSVVEFNAIGLSENVSSGAAEESVQIKENSTVVTMDGDTMIDKSCMHSTEKSLTFVPNVEDVDNVSAEARNLFSENLSAETSIPSNENLSAETSNMYSENPTAENETRFTENPPTEISIPFRENLSAEISTPTRENPSTETSVSFVENSSAKISTPFSETPPTETSTSVGETPAESGIPLSESPSQMLKLKNPESPKLSAGSLSKMSSIEISFIEENETVMEKDTQQIISDTSMVSAGDLAEVGCESSGLMQVDSQTTVCGTGATHLNQDDSFNEKEDASLPLESNDMDTEVVRAHGNQKNVEASLRLESTTENSISAYNIESDVSVRVDEVSDQRSSPDTATAENAEQPKSPIFGVSLVHQGSKENTEVGCPSEGTSQIEFSQVEIAVASVSKNSPALVEKEAPLNHDEKAVHVIDAHCVMPVETCNASQTEKELGTKSGSQDRSKKLETNPSDSSEKTGNSSQTGCLQDPKESIIEVNKSNEHQTFVDVARPSDDVADDSSLPPKTVVDVQHEVRSVPVDTGTPVEENITFEVDKSSSLPPKTVVDVQHEVRSVSVDTGTPVEENITFEVNKRTDLGQEGKDSSLSYPTFKVTNLPKITEGPSKDSSSNQMDSKKFHEVSVSPQNPSGLTSQSGVKAKSERKPRRKSVGKENARKGTAAMNIVRGEITPVLLTPTATVKPHENVPKPGVAIPSQKIPDLNNSTSIYQQPFTDSQQVQLRAQILVYGSLISGSPPEETHMIAAFGQSDGGRIWEGVWHACVERLHNQKSQPKSSTPIQSQSDMKDAGSRSDQVIKYTPVQNKILSSPIGGPNNKSTPPFVSPMIPFSSPLWNATTPSDNLQSGGIPKAARFDYHQTPPQRPTYQTPPVHNYNSSWLSQGLFSGQWLAASPIPTFNPTPRLPSLPITESVKFTPVIESGSSVIKHTSDPPVLNSAPIVFPEASVSGKKRSTVSSDQLDSKSRKKKKGISVVSAPFSTSVVVSGPTFMTSTSSPAKYLSAVASPTHHQSAEKVVISEETLAKVEESKLQAKEAALHADNAMSICNIVWSQVERQYNQNLNSNDDAKLVSAAVSIAAAASVAKVAAAAAKIASDVAEQARLMTNKFNKSQNLAQGKAAENLNAIVKAAELAAEAVSQAGNIVAMSEPYSLKDLVEGGPEGYWKTPQSASKQQALIAENLNVTEKANAETALDEGILATIEVDGTSVPFTSQRKDKRKPQTHKGSEDFKTAGAVSESQIRSTDTSMVGQPESKVSSVDSIESDIEEGCFVEVCKDNDKHNRAWFGANVLSLKDGKALVSYTEIESDEGSGKLKEWLPLEVEGSEVPKIRLAHPVTTIQGTRKRRRTAATDFMWSSGDRVDVWMQNHWREGIVMDTNKIDITSLTVQFPGQGETSVVRSWFVRPTLIWKDGKWIMAQTSEKHLSSPGNMQQEKRLKLGSPIVESKLKAGSSENVDLVDPRKQEVSRTLPLSTKESVFNIGSTRDKVNTNRKIRSGLHKEGSGVTFGVPKPGKNQKFMDVSKHYVTDGSNITTHDSIKFTKYLIPNPPGSRGWKNSSRSDLKEKQAAETKPQLLRSRKPPVPSFRTLSTKSTTNKNSLDSDGDSENHSGQQIQKEHGSSSSIGDKSERLNKRKFAPAKAAKVEKSLPEAAEPRRSNRRIQPTSRLLEGLQSSMSITKIPAVSHSTQRKVTPIQKETGTVAKRKENS